MIWIMLCFLTNDSNGLRVNEIFIIKTKCDRYFHLKPAYQQQNRFQLLEDILAQKSATRIKSWTYSYVECILTSWLQGYVLYVKFEETSTSNLTLSAYIVME